MSDALASVEGMNTSADDFSYRQRGLDASQVAVVTADRTESGVVVGAAGTGKTTALVERVTALVQSGYAPDQIVVLTPSRQMATALRDRLALAVGAATSGPMARSLASFAFALVRASEVQAGREPPQLLTGGDEDQMIRDLLDGDADDELSGGGRSWPENLPALVRGTPGFRAEVRAFMAECATLGVEPGRLETLSHAQQLPSWQPMSSFYREYLQVRAQMRGAFRDVAGLIREAVGLVRAGDPAATAALGGIRAILVDDAQELTRGGVELLEACATRDIAVMAFGDPDVSAGSFRGATPENFARLASSLGVVRVLSRPHRGTRALQSTVARVVQRIGAVGVTSHRLPPEQSGPGQPSQKQSGPEQPSPEQSAPDESVRAVLLRSAAEEYDAIARILRERHVHDQVPWSQCAVIAHDTRQVNALEAELAAREVPTRASGPARTLSSSRPVRDLLRLVDHASTSAQEWTYDDAAEILLGTMAGLDPIQLRRLRGILRRDELAAQGDRAASDLLVSGMRHPLELELIDTREARRAARVFQTLHMLSTQLDAGATAHELLWTAWDRSGLQYRWREAALSKGPLADQANRDLDAIVSLFQAAKRFGEHGTDVDPRPFVRGMLGTDVADDRLETPSTTDVVRVLTPAGAVGTEFDTVVIAGVQDRVWPNTRLRGSVLSTWRLSDADASTGVPGRGDRDSGGNVPDSLDRRRLVMYDELRLFARAVSRADRRLIVTAVDDDDTGPSVFWELLPDPEQATPEMAHPLSLRGMVAMHRRALTEHATHSTPSARSHAAGQLAVLARAGVPGADPDHWYGVLPATSLAPMHDPTTEMVRVSPSGLDKAETCALDWAIGALGGDSGGVTAGIGTILHSALELTDGDDEAAMWRHVQQRWGELVFDAGWQEQIAYRRARDMVRRLHLYLRDFDREGGTLVGAEPHFEVPIPLAAEDDVVQDDAAENIALGDGAVEDEAVASEREVASSHSTGAVLSGYIDRVEKNAAGEIVIVDLKTGKREPQTDKAVQDNPQLSAYQLAHEAGQIPEVRGLAPGGAKLLVLRPTAKAREYVTPRQQPLTEESREAFLNRVRAVVEVMSATHFLAPYEEHCRDDHSYGLCRIHTVGAVSSS